MTNKTNIWVINSSTIFQLGDVDYVHAKRINDSDPDYRYSEQFRQRVGFNTSSIHIPVEIYEGGQSLWYILLQ